MYLGIRGWRRVGSGICMVGGVGSWFNHAPWILCSAVRTISKLVVLIRKNWLWHVYATRRVELGLWGRCVSFVRKNCILYARQTHSYHSLFLHINTASFRFYLAFYSYTFSWDRAHIYIRHFTIPYCLHIVHEQQYPIVKEWHLMNLLKLAF